MYAKFLAAGLVMSTTGAAACVPPPGWPQHIRLSPEAAALQLTRSAKYVDLVQAERLSPDFDLGSRSRSEAQAWVGAPPEHLRTVDDVLREWRASWPEAMRIHYRVVTSFKSKSGPSFDLNGLPESNAAAIGIPIRGRNRLEDLKYFLDQQDLAAWAGPGSCQSEVFASVGKTYIVFRDAKGWLLREPIKITLKGRNLWVAGPAYIAVSGPTDPWLRLVKEAISRR